MKILKLPAVIEITSLSRATIYRLSKKGKFPKPRAIGERSIGFLESEVTQWIEAKFQFQAA